MELGHTGAALLAKKFGAINHPVTRCENLLILELWGCRIQFQMERHEHSNGSVAVTYRVATYLERLMNPVIDYAIGWGRTLDQANEMATETYMGSVFPVIHAICCTSKCGYGVECEVHYHKNAETGIVDDWRIVHGPPVILSAQDEKIGREQLFEIIAPDLDDVIEENGTYWFKCFVGNFGETVDADCFLNNQKWPEKIEAFKEFGQSMPSNTSIKQHILICPDELETVVDWKAKRRCDTEDSLRHLSIPPKPLKTVLDALELYRQFGEIGEPFLRDLMIKHGINEATSRRLTAYIPNICARVVWEPSGVEFGHHVQLFNFANGLSQTIELKQEPLYQAARQVIQEWVRTEQNAGLIETISAMGADQSAILDALSQGAKPESLKLAYLIISADITEGDVDPELQKLLGFRRKPWWKFW